MRTRLRHILEVLLSSYWFVPTLMLAASAVLALVTIYVDEWIAEESIDVGWFYGGGPDGARVVLGTIAGSVITVAGVVFSITIATLTQASSQFGPRLLRNFMRNRANQFVLGVFVSTFLYCLLVLRKVRGEDHNEFVPQIAVSFSILLALASIGVLVYFIHHVSTNLQAPHVIDNVFRDLLRIIDRIYPKSLGQASAHGAEDRRTLDAKLEQSSRPVRSSKSGYLQVLDADSLMDLLRERDLVAELVVRPGKPLVENAIIARVHPAAQCDDDVSKAIDGAMIVGAERTSEQDVEFAIDQLVEIAVRALSTGVNDPFTAINVLDRLAPALARLAGREFPSTVRVDGDGKPRLIVDASDFSGLCDAALNMIRQNGAKSIAVGVRLLETVEQILAACPDMPDDRRACLVDHARQTFEQAMRNDPPTPDADDLRERLKRVQRLADECATDAV